MSRDLHCDQPAPRQLNAPMASNPRNPATSPHSWTSGHLSHCDNCRKKRGLEGGKQRIKKCINAENNCLKEIQRMHITLPNMGSNSHYTETSWPTSACACMHETSWLLSETKPLVDLHYVNLHLGSCKFKYEDKRTAADLFSLGDWFFKFGYKRGYHQGEFFCLALSVPWILILLCRTA